MANNQAVVIDVAELIRELQATIARLETENAKLRQDIENAAAENGELLARLQNALERLPSRYPFVVRFSVGEILARAAQLHRHITRTK